VGRGSGKGGRSRTSGGGGGLTAASGGASTISPERQAQINRRATIGTRILALGALALLTFLTRGRRV
jgi:hypothetical protein